MFILKTWTQNFKNRMYKINSHQLVTVTTTHNYSCYCHDNWWQKQQSWSSNDVYNYVMLQLMDIIIQRRLKTHIFNLIIRNMLTLKAPHQSHANLRLLKISLKITTVRKSVLSYCTHGTSPYSYTQKNNKQTPQTNTMSLWSGFFVQLCG